MTSLQVVLRAGYRLTAIVAVSAMTIAAIARSHVGRPTSAARLARRARQATIMRRAARAMIRVLGMQLEHRGPHIDGPALVVANHRSWLDILLCFAVQRRDATEPLAFVAKREVAAWPLIGRLARDVGVVFIDRTRPRDLLRALADVEHLLRGGSTVVLFPEATTTAAREPNAFRSGLFESAMRTGRPVLPCALSARLTATGTRSCDRDDSAHSHPYCWIGAESLLRNLLRLSAAPPITLGIHVAAAMEGRPTRTSRVALSRERKAVTIACRVEIVRRLRHSGRAHPERAPADETQASASASVLVKQNLRPMESSEREIFV